MGTSTRRVIAVVLGTSLVLAGAGNASAALTDRERAGRAVGFIASQQQEDGSIPAFSPVGSTADAALAFVAAGRGERELRRALRYLRTQAEEGNVTAVGLKAKVVMAFAAAGRPARTVGGERFVAEIRQALRGENAVFDTALGMLALAAVDATVPAAALEALDANRCPDGGWAYDGYNVGEDEHCSSGDGDWYASDTNTTAYAVMALEAVVTMVPGRGVALTPFDFFEAIRDEGHGGWGYTWDFPTTDANSTALVLQAYAAAGLETPGGARKALRRLQYPRCGAFAFTWFGDTKTDPDVGATIGAVPGLLGKAFPYTGSVDRPAPETPACA